MKGSVIKSTGSRYCVELMDGNVVEARMKGRFRLQGIRTTNPIAVGDWVEVEGEQITSIKERRNYIIRKASNLSKESHILAANLDQVFLFVTLAQPETPNEFVDRFLVTAKAYDVPVVLVVNKVDLLPEDDEYLKGYCYLYRSLGYEVLTCSVQTGEGIEALKTRIDGKVSLLAGNSGVGKSSFLNAVDASLGVKTGSISKVHQTGMHTTTYAEMFAVAGGKLIDIPGIKGFGLIDMEPAEIGHYFPEIFQQAKLCKFADCLHLNEPDCAVRRAVEEHLISESRYQSYLSILEDISAGKYR
jgi:ribosome biogenesis GTPase